MNALVGYASSDEEDDAPSERPAKIAKTGDSPAIPSTSALLPAEQPAPTVPGREEHISSAGPAPGPSAVPSTTVSAPSIDAEAPPFSLPSYERHRLRELTMPTVPNFDIPDSPPPPPQNSEEAAALAATTKKFDRFLELKKQGVHFNERLQNTSSLRNPGLLPKLMEFAGIGKEESYASSLPAELAVPVRWPEENYIESLMRLNERKEKERMAERDRVDFAPASKLDRTSANGAPAGETIRKSRFDKK